MPVTDFAGTEGVDALDAAAAPARTAGLQVELGGQVAENFSAPSGTAETVGIIAALIILVFAFGSVVAAGLPLVVALVGLGIGAAADHPAGRVTDVSTTAPTSPRWSASASASTTRCCWSPGTSRVCRPGCSRAAAATATATAGASVVFAGTTVLVSLLGLRLAGAAGLLARSGYATAHRRARS